MPNISAAEFYAPMNASVLRANAAADACKRAEWDYEDRARQQTLQDAAFAREDRLSQDNEKRRRFDAQLAAFSQLFGAQAPQPQTGQPANALFRMRGQMGGGEGVPGEDGIDRRAINNSLARYLQGMR